MNSMSFRVELCAPGHRRRPVVVVDVVIDDKPTWKSRVIGVPGYGVGC